MSLFKVDTIEKIEHFEKTLKILITTVSCVKFIVLSRCMLRFPKILSKSLVFLYYFDLCRELMSLATP